MSGRVDVDRYKTALEVCLNYLPVIQGALVRRPGTYFAAEIKDSTKKSRLQRFEFSITQAYAIEFGNLSIRFYRDNGQIVETALNITGITQANPAVVTSVAHGLSNGQEVFITAVGGMTQLNGRNFKVANVAANTFELQYMDGTNVDSTTFGAYTSGGTASRVYTVTSTYLEADLFALKFTQSADVLYITHKSYRPRKLTRTAHTSWTISAIDFLDGPYLAENTTSTTLTPSATSGSVTITASATTGINGGTGFVSTDVGRLIRIKDAANNWTWLEITAFTSTTVVTATVRGPALATTAARSTWRLGVWSDTTGWPSCSCFHEDRLLFAGATSNPQRMDGSNTGDYENFAPTQAAGTITDAHAISFTFNANDVNVARWLSSEEKGLLAGTLGGEWVVKPSTQGEALTPTNISAKQVTFYGSADIQPVQVGKSTVYVQRSKKKVREMTYFFDVDGFRSPDLTQLSDHITGELGIAQVAFQKEPQSIFWCVREDGVLASMTYERDLESLKVGWARHIVGGVSDAASSDAVVESACCIPAPDGTRDELWLIVRRRINGKTVRYVEYMDKLFDAHIEQKDSFFVDSGLTYDAPLVITGITNASPAVVTSNGHGLSNGDRVLISDVKGYMESSSADAISAINGHSFVVAGVTANTFELTNKNGGTGNFDGTSFTVYVSGGEARKYVSTVSGLWHLEGQSVTVLGDGAVQPSKTVANGAVTLATSATTVQLGLPYNSDGQLLRLEAGSADGTAMGKTRRVHRLGLLLYRTLGLKIGTTFDNLDPIVFRETSDALTRAVPLFSGIKSETLEADYDFENQVCWRQDQPLPGTILALMPQQVTQDR
jgi:hypothetical protein